MTEEAMFIRALEISDPMGRARFLDWTCAGNPAVRGRLQRLLERHEQAGGFLAHPAVAALQAGCAGRPDEITAEPGVVTLPAGRSDGE